MQKYSLSGSKNSQIQIVFKSGHAQLLPCEGRGGVAKKTNMIKLEFEHRQAGHCESGVTRNLLNYYNCKITEPLTFGIGAGLFFSYLPFLKMQHAPTTSFRVWPGQVFDRATKELGVKTAIHTFSDPRESMEKLNETLERG